jgi:hypothetical protein
VQSRKSLIARLIIVFGITCIAISPFLSTLVDDMSSRWKRLNAPDRVSALIDFVGDTHGFDVVGIYAVSDAGQIFECQFTDLTCKPIKNVGEGRYLSGRNDCVGRLVFPDTPSPSKAERMFCSGSVDPTHTKVRIDEVGEMWVSRVYADSDSIRLFLMTCLGVFMGVVAIGVGASLTILSKLRVENWRQ